MKRNLIPLLIGLLAARTAWAEPLNNKMVAENAKWLVHLDLEQFRATQVGKFLTTKVLNEALKKPLADVKNTLNLDLDWTKLKSVTVYGAEFRSNSKENGVMLVSAAPELVDGVFSVVTSQIGLGSLLKAEQVMTNPFVMYQFNKDFFAVRSQKSLVLMGKYSNELFQAQQVIEGKAANLTRSKSFTGYPEVPCPFVFIGMAEGFNQETAMPPQAEILKNTDGGRLVLGESPDKLIANIDLRVKNQEISQQIQQTVQGLLAFGSLALAKEPDAAGIVELLRNIQIKTNNHLVSLNLAYPVDKAMTLLGDAVDKQQKEKKPETQPPTVEKSSPEKAESK